MYENSLVSEICYFVTFHFDFILAPTMFHVFSGYTYIWVNFASFYDLSNHMSIQFSTILLSQFNALVPATGFPLGVDP